MTRRNSGFSLLELLTAVTIIGILLSIAIPSYKRNIIRTNRVAAQTSMLEIAQRERQYLMDTRSFTANLSDLKTTIPATVSQYYTITLAVGAGAVPTFTVTATPMTGTMQSAEPTLTLDQAGTKLPSGSW